MIATFTYTLAGGILAILATGRPDQIAWRFLRLTCVLDLALASLVTVTRLREPQPFADGLHSVATVAGLLTAATAILLVLMAPFASRRTNAWRGLCALGGAAGIVAGCIGAVSIRGETGAAAGLVVTSQVLSAGLIGSITVAWLLGHAYLTATKMTIAPLRHFSLLLLWAAIARGAFFAVSLAAAWWMHQPPEPSVFAMLINSWLIASLRIAVGLVAVGAFAYMVSDCVRLRSTQSATGILYFGSLFAYVGELAALQLLGECGWPI